MRRNVLALLCVAMLCSCGLQSYLLPPATPAPFCAPFEELGSVQLDYAIATPPTLAVSAADAEREARARFVNDDAVTTCSVRLARYDNLSQHMAAVWVVHVDGLALPTVGGDLFSSPPPSPALLRRGLILVTTEAPAAHVFAVFAGP